MLRYDIALSYDLATQPRRMDTPLNRIAVLTVLLVATIAGMTASASSSNAVYQTHDKAQKAVVSVVAISTSVHDSTSNEQVYLALMSVHGEATHLARLVDTYPFYEKPIRMSLLKEHRTFEMMLVRDDSIFLRNAAVYLGGNSTWLSDTFTIDSITSHPTDVLPSYTIIHSKTILAKVRR